MISYANENIKFEGCPACAYAKHKFSLPCGMAFENERFTLSQDWELPIQGFFVVSPIKCVEKFEELETKERIEMFDIVDKTIKILRKNNICDRFDVIFEEKENRHLHVWIMPRYQWMNELVEGITPNIGQIYDYAVSTMKTEENNKKISEITNLVKTYFEKSECMG